MSFTLKNYQQRVLAGLDEFLHECRLSEPAAAYKKIAHRKDKDGKPENPYAAPEYKEIEGLQGRPHVCLRVPTGGGKTYLAALSLQYAARFMETETPTVLWFVPSDAIRRQTVDMLNNPEHPCRQALNDAFGMMTRVCDIEDFANLRPQDFTSQACIIVSTSQMFRIRETAKTPEGRMTRATRKIYATNEALEPHFAQFLPPAPPRQLECDEQGAIKLSFANLLFLLQPAVVLDEAHGFVSELSKTVLQRINPACVIEWTATPRDKPGGEPLHNVLLSVGAEELRDEEMVKLPVRVTAHTDWEKAVNGAVNERKNLAKLAKDGKDPVRPIVLYKAQNKNADVPVGRLKQHLTEVEGIAEKTIAIATGETKELGDVNLLAMDCGIEHIITVEALREGWDCPFAYILCPVDNVRSATAVEQLLGRVLRMPFARRRKYEALNCAYAHVSAETFLDAVGSLREKMATGLGFEEEEIRWSLQESFSLPAESEGLEAQEEAAVFQLESMPDLAALPAAERDAAENAIQFVAPRPSADGDDAGVTIILTKPVSATVQDAIINATAQAARKEAKLKIDRVNKALGARHAPAGRGIQFAPLTQLSFILPETKKYVVVNAATLHEAAEWNDLGDDCLITDFSIEENAQIFEIKLKDGKVVQRKTSDYTIPLFPERSLAVDVTSLTAWLEKVIRKSDGRYFPETLKELVGKNIRALMETGTTLAQLVRAKYVLAMSLKQWLNEHAGRVMEKTRQRMLFDNDDVRCEIKFSFEPRAYHPGEQPYEGNYQFQKHYYGVIGAMDSDEEEECAIAIDGMKEVRHWIRNMPRKPNSFSLPLSCKDSFYPDFVAELTNGKILVVEYKGAHLWAGHELHRRIGALWEQQSKGSSFFLMASRREGVLNVEKQIENKINEIFNGP